MDVLLSPGTTSLGIINVGRVGSHSTDQPSGRASGQDRGREGSSKMFPEKHITSKAEYTNTQQGLPGIGYTLARN
jgi:hypothetical protein